MTLWNRDPYGRVIARCTIDGEDIAIQMIEEGLAWAYIRFSDDYVAFELEAQVGGNGIWQADMQTAKDYRDDVWERAVEAAPGRCPIKGNVNGSERIYHTPWSPNYDNVKITADKGERWFCDEREALDAGWRAVRSR